MLCHNAQGTYMLEHDEASQRPVLPTAGEKRLENGKLHQDENRFQCPSETTSTTPSITFMAV